MRGTRYRHRPTEVVAAQFLPHQRPWPSGVSEGECYCAGLAQDGRRCEIHAHNGKPYYVTWHDRRRIDPGSYLVYSSGGMVKEVWTRAAFEASYEQAPAHADQSATVAP